MRLADAHIHLFASGYAGRYGRSPAGGPELPVYEGYRRKHGIDYALVVGYEGKPRYAGNNDYLADLVTRPGHDWIVPVAFAPAGEPPTPEQLDAYWRAGFRGLSLYLTTTEDARLVTDWPAATMAELNRAGALISVNAWPPGHGALRTLAEALRGCTLLVSHLGLPGRHAEVPSPEQARRRLGPLLVLAALPHVFVKLSGLYAISDPAHAWPHAAAEPYVTEVLDRFRTTRVCWGSDFSPCLDAVSFAQAVDVPLVQGLSPQEREQVMGANLARLIGDSAGPGGRPPGTPAKGRHDPDRPA